MIFTFRNPRVAQPYSSHEVEGDWYISVSDRGDPYHSDYREASFSHGLLPDEDNEIVLDLPDALLQAQQYYARLSANASILRVRFSTYSSWRCFRI